MRISEAKLGQLNPYRDNVLPGPVQVIAVTGGKGGTGKTSIAVNLSMAMAKAGHSTLLMDADPGMANVDVLLGLETHSTLTDVLQGHCSLEDILLDVNENLKVVPAASGIRQIANSGSAECTGLMRAFSELKNPVDTLVIDTASGIAECVASFCRAATEVLVVICNEPASITDSVSQIQMLFSEYGVSRFRILANKVGTAHEGNQLFKTLLHRLQDNDEIICSFAGYIPDDEHLKKAAMQHQTVVESFPRSRSAMALKHLAGRVNDWPRPEHPGGHLEFFVERLIYNENINMEVAS